MTARRLLEAELPSLVGVLAAMAVASALILACHQAPLSVYRLLLAGTWQSGYGIGQVLFKATPLIFTGLAVAVPLRAGLFNIGAEGQAAAGALAVALVGAALPPTTPAPLAVLCCLAAGFAGGALVGAVPGVLRATRGAHEVITTIMLNFVVLALLELLGKRLYLRETMHTSPVIAAAELPRAAALLPSLSGSALSAALAVALLAAAAVWLLLSRSAFGFRLGALGQSPAAAAAFGAPVARDTALALVVGGGLAGLCGVNFVLGYKHYYEEGCAGGVGFVGIAVALLGRGHPAGIVAAAVLLGTLAQGGLAVNAVVPKEVVDVFQAALVVVVAAAVGATLRRGRAP